LNFDGRRLDVARYTWHTDDDKDDDDDGGGDGGCCTVALVIAHFVARTPFLNRPTDIESGPISIIIIYYNYILYYIILTTVTH